MVGMTCVIKSAVMDLFWIVSGVGWGGVGWGGVGVISLSMFPSMLCLFILLRSKLALPCGFLATLFDEV